MIAQQRLPAAAIAALAALWLVAGAAPPQPTKQAAAACSIDLYFVDQDASTNIRAAPGADAAVKATISPATTVAHVTGSANGWFRIDKVTDAENDKVMFDGDGWVHKSVVGLSVASGDHSLLSAPAPRARKVRRLVPDGNLLEPQSCRGTWTQVRADKAALGWIDAATICANPLTTCS